MPIKTESDLSPNGRNLWLKALSAIELKNYGYAISLLQNVLRETPEFLHARQLMRKAAIGNTKGKKSFLSGLGGAGLGGFKNAGLVKKDPLAAMDAAEKILETDPGSTAGNRLLKDAAMAAGHPEIAGFALETLSDANPKDLKIMHELAAHYLEHNEPEKSLNAFNRILEIAPADMVAIKGSKDASAKLSMSTGGWETAKDYRDLIKNKEEAELLEQKNRVVRSDEMIESQLAELAPIYEADPSNIEVVRKIAALYEQKGDIPSAISYYQWAGELGKGSDPAIMRKVADLQLRVHEEEIQRIETWLAANGREGEEAEARMKELEKLKTRIAEMRLEEARKRVERNPTDLQLRYELGELLFLTGNYTDAIPELQRARQNPNARIKAINLLGQCMVKKGMFDLAANQFREAAAELGQMDALKKDLIYNLGLTYEKMGQKENYIEAMKKIYEVDFGYRDVAARVEQSYSA